jgi:hypothetical protein
MQLQKQLIHTPLHFLPGQENVCQLDIDERRRPFAENHLSTPDNILIERGNFHVRIADTQSVQNQVSALISRMYAWRGYRLEAAETRVPVNQTTLQVCGGRDTLGTLTLNIDSEDGLLADDLYRREVDVLRKRGATVCELTGLAVSAQLGSSELLATLFHLLHIVGRRLHRATDAVIEINPRHSLYYQRVLGFRQIGERKICGRVNAPAVLLHIEADFVEEQINRYAGQHKKTGHSLYPYFFSCSDTELISQRILGMSHRLPASRETHN